MKLTRCVCIIGLISLVACSDLDEKLNDGISVNEPGSVDIQQLLNGAYGDLRDLQSQDNLSALTDHPSDEMAGPTRGRDWDDAGVWRVLHTHSWTTAHPYVNSVWRTLNRNSFNAQQVLCNGASGQTAAEATFLRVFNDFLTFDLFGKIPRRECNENLVNPPSIILTRGEAIDILISELESALPTLPDTRDINRATQSAARALLMKLYLNRAVYKATDASGAPQPGPYSFDAGDMNQVIEYADEVIASGYTLDENYFDNFVPNNDAASSELIFVSRNESGAVGGPVRSRWFMTSHYNQNPSGWNGFVALADLYNRFESGDRRLQAPAPYIGSGPNAPRAGFLVGQQYDAEGNPLQDRAGNPLAFQPDFSLIETGEDLEVAGIRVIKYTPDFTTAGDIADNDFVFLRYADVLLMKAEAILRGGTASTTALDIVNNLRSVRGASQLSAVTLDVLLDERSRELYWEGWRRNDLIRFGEFLGTWQEKPNTSASFRLLFPIPAEAISTNPNLEQNPGY